MKPPTACLQCRERKLKCRSTARSKTCTNCSSKARCCSLAESASNHISKSLPGPLSFSPDFILELVDNYIRCLHDRPHSLFHIPTLLEAVKSNTLDRALLYAICSLGCRFAHDDRTRDLRTSYLRQAESLFQARVEHVDVESVQTCILLANSYSAESQSNKEALYYAMAVRMAQMLQLNIKNVRDGAILAETKKRVFLSLFMADRWASYGLTLPMQIRAEELPKDAAIREDRFQTPEFGTSDLGPCQERGLWAYKTDIAVIFGRIQSLLQSVVRGQPGNERLHTETESLAGSLRAWEVALPANITFCPENLKVWKNAGHGGTFIDLYLGYHYYSTLLLFPFLGVSGPGSRERHAYAEQCREHALQYSSLLALARSQNDYWAVHGTVGHMTVVSSSVLLFYLLEGSQAEVSASRQALVSNFDALIELQRLWPGLTRWIQRLFIVQKVCLSSSASTTFAMSSWVLRLLVEYALPLEDRTSSDDKASSSAEKRGAITTAAWNELSENWTSEDLHKLL